MPYKTKRRPSVSRRLKIIMGVCAVLVVGLVITALALNRQEYLQKAAEAAASITPEAPYIAPPIEVHNLVAIGDSMTAGANNEVIWPEALEDGADIKVEVFATGGAAYTQERKTLMDQAKEAAKVRPESIIIAGSVNDRESDPAVITEAALEVFTFLKTTTPDSEVVVIGPLAYAPSASDEIRRANEAVKAAADAAGVPFLDAVGESWLDAPALIQDDNLHPTDEGQQVIADRIAAAIEQQQILWAS